jgi:hypothetical protein
MNMPRLLTLDASKRAIGVFLVCPAVRDRFSDLPTE